MDVVSRVSTLSVAGGINPLQLEPKMKNKNAIDCFVVSERENIESGDLDEYLKDGWYDHTENICDTGRERGWSNSEISYAILELEHACHVRGIVLPLSSFDTVPWQPILEQMREMKEQMQEMQAELARLKAKA